MIPKLIFKTCLDRDLFVIYVFDTLQEATAHCLNLIFHIRKESEQRLTFIIITFSQDLLQAPKLSLRVSTSLPVSLHFLCFSSDNPTSLGPRVVLIPPEQEMNRDRKPRVYPRTHRTLFSRKGNGKFSENIKPF